MKLTNLTIKDLFNDSAKLTFLVGAGCSVDAPSCLPEGRAMMEIMIKYTCAESEREKILGLKDLRFEQLVEIIRARLDPKLKLIDYYGQCDKPNTQHFFLVKMISKGHFVMTTNFDFLIEYALLESGIPKDEIIPVITKQDFEKYKDPNELINKGKKAVYKIHGSTKNIINNLDTKDSLVATIQAFGLGKEGENIFQLEPFKRPLFENILKNRTLVIMGYSGSDDFDIVPTLVILKNLENIVWINYIQNDNRIEKIYEIDQSSFEGTKKLNKVDQILTNIYQAHNAKHIYRVDANTTRLLETLIDSKPNLTSNTFSINPMIWFKNNVTPSDEFEKYFIPYKIYDSFDLVDDAMICSNIILKIAKEKGNNKWQSSAINNIGFLLYKKDELDAALKHYKEALAIDEQIGDLWGKATRLNNIGALLERQRKLDAALKYYKEALEIDKQLDDLHGKATRLNNIGELLYKNKKDRLDEALEYFKEALVIDGKLGDVRGRSARLNNIGRLLEDRGEFDEALKYYKEALAIADQLSDVRAKTARLTNIGSIFHWKRELNEALKYYKEALEIANQLGDVKVKAIILNNIGEILYLKGERDEALKYYKEALAFFKRLDSTKVKIIEKNIAIINRKQNN